MSSRIDDQAAGRPDPRPGRRPTRLQTWLLQCGLIVAALLAATPLIWLVCASFKTPVDQGSSFLLPWAHLDRLTLNGYAQLAATPFWNWMVNSLFLAASHTVLVVLLSSLGGYALAKHRFAGKGVIAGALLATMMLPGQVLLPASYELMFRFDWLNTYWAILIPGAVSVFGILLFRGAYADVPDELLEAGRIDGCGELGLWWSVATPCVRPMVGAFTLMAFTGAWASFLWPQVVLGDAAMQPLTVGIASLGSADEYRADFSQVMAATVLGIIPVVVLFFALQREFVAGLTSGAVKG